jgi:hypothetical protein
VDGTARLINGPAFASALGLNLYDGYLTVDRQEPAADPAFSGFPGPQIDDGPHFFYALQWFFFALLAIGGLLYFSRQDMNSDNSAAAPGGTTGAEGGPEPAAAATGPADRRPRPDPRHPDGGAGLD